MERRRRRPPTAEFKVMPIQQCLKPRVSIAAVALSCGLSAGAAR